MNISISARLKPFSHTIGTKCLLPGTQELVEAFPQMLRIGSVSIPLSHDAYTRPFTLQQDLEKNCVWVFGKSFRYKIQASPVGLEIKSSDKTWEFKTSSSFYMPSSLERLSLGSHKAQDWDLVTRRMDLKEILPLVFALGQKVPFRSFEEMPSPSNLQAVESFYRSHFEGMLIPKEETFLSLAFQVIRSLFFKEEESNFSLLQHCLFPEGRMVNIQTKIGVLSFEWSKHRLRRAVFEAKETGEIHWKLVDSIRAYRVKTFKNEKGRMHLAKDPLLVEKDTTYFLDRFFE